MAGEKVGKVRLRLFQAGDLPGRKNNINVKEVKQLVKVINEKGWEAWGYTHKPVCKKSLNSKIIKFCNKNGVTINLSANNVYHADELFKLNIGPVVITLPEKSTIKETPNGNKIIICPAIKNKTTCSTCGGSKGSLCFRVNRNYIIGFLAHGSGKGKVK